MCIVGSMNNNPKYLAASLQSLNRMMKHSIRQTSTIQLEVNYQMTPARLSVIQFLIEVGASSLNAIALNRGVSAATMSRIVGSLIADGLILKANSKSDKRSKMFFASRKAIELFEQYNEIEMKKYYDVLSKLSDDDKNNIVQSINLLTKIYKEIN